MLFPHSDRVVEGVRGALAHILHAFPPASQDVSYISNGFHLKNNGQMGAADVRPAKIW